MDEPLTIEWICKQFQSTSIFRMDISREDHHGLPGREAIAAEMIWRCADEEATVVGALRFEASHKKGTISRFVFSTDPDQWTTLIGDTIAHWPKEWRIQKPILLRAGRWRESPSRTRWDKINRSNLTVLHHLARLQGAIEQVESGRTDVWERFILSEASGNIAHQITQVHRDWGALTDRV